MKYFSDAWKNTSVSSSEPKIYSKFATNYRPISLQSNMFEGFKEIIQNKIKVHKFKYKDLIDESWTPYSTIFNNHTNRWKIYYNKWKIKINSRKTKVIYFTHEREINKIVNKLILNSKSIKMKLSKKIIFKRTFEKYSTKAINNTSKHTIILRYI